MDKRQLLKSVQELLKEQQRREEFALSLYRPTPKQESFHRATVKARIVRGGNRSGKSTAGALEFAHAATGIPLICSDGSEIPYKYPDRPLIMWCIGIDEDHIGDTLYRLLFRGGLFKVIDDAETGKPRIWDPRRADDLEREHEIRQSGPMIPPEMVVDRVWTKKGKQIFSKITLTNGTEIFAYPSGGDCPSGVPVDLLWIDEDIKYPEYVADWQGRLIDTGGRMIWTAFPWASNDALMGLSQRAEKEQDNPDAGIREWKLVMDENPYLRPQDKHEALAGWEAQGDIVLAARNAGEFPTDHVLMYPNFNRKVHGIGDGYLPEECEAAAMLEANNGEPYDDWMRLLVLDPGSSKACVLFATVPPPEYGELMIIYDEVFQKTTDARMMAADVKLRTHGQSFYRFIMDCRAARQTPLGFGRTVESEWVAAFSAAGIVDERGMTSFLMGNDNVALRTSRVRQLLAIENGAHHPRLLFYLPKTPRTQWEFRNYKRRLSHKEYLDEPIPANNDAMNGIEYLAAADIRYHKPVARTAKPFALQRHAALNRLFGNDSRPKTAVVMGSPSAN